MQKVQSVQSIFKNYNFDNEEVYNEKTGKTAFDIDSKEFSEILKEALKSETKGK